MEGSAKLGKGRFTRVIEDFKCEFCGFIVKGSGYTDHCPNCLTSKHVDVMPGDRASKCKGEMRPIRAEYKNGEYKIEYVCSKCNQHKKVNSAKGDNEQLLEELSSQ